METASLDALPEHPLVGQVDHPTDDLVLPVDIYTDGILIIDDGYDRAKMSVPGFLHIERVAKWSHERFAQALAGRSSGPSDPYGQEPAATNPKAIMPPHRQSAAPAVRSPIALPPTETQSVARASVRHSIALDIDNTLGGRQ